MLIIKNNKGEIIESDNNGFIYVTAISDMNIVEIISIPDTTNYLFCYNNQLTSLPENLPKDLKELYCWNNKIEKLPNLRNLEKLREINCDMRCFEPYMLEMNNINFILSC